MLKILIAIDGSDLALDAVRYALRLAQSGLQISSVVLANVQEPASLYELVTTRDPELIAAASIEAGEHLIAPARALLEATGLECESAVGVGDPAHTLVDIIETAGCDLVLIGARPGRHQQRAAGFGVARAGACQPGAGDDCSPRGGAVCRRSG